MQYAAAVILTLYFAYLARVSLVCLVNVGRMKVRFGHWSLGLIAIGVNAGFAAMVALWVAFEILRFAD